MKLMQISNSRPLQRRQTANSDTVIARSQRVARMRAPLAPRNDGVQFQNTTPRSRGTLRPSCAKIVRPKKTEGAGNAGCPMHPQPRMQNKTSIRVSHHGHTGTTRHSPRNGFTAYFALSSVTTLFDTVACASSHRLDAKDWGVG